MSEREIRTNLREMLRRRLAEVVEAFPGAAEEIEPGPWHLLHVCDWMAEDGEKYAGQVAQLTARFCHNFIAELDTCDDVARLREVLALCRMPYNDYLKTDHWQAVRAGAIERAGGRCQLCNRPDGLNVHHRTYERRGEELPEDVIALCRGCHAKFHDKPL